MGSIFSADGSQDFDIRRRIGLAMGRCGALRHVFDSKGVPLTLKLKIYAAAVVSIMTYGCEAWNIDEATRAKLNGANARLLSRFTGKTSHEEASERKRTDDMVTAVRKRRHQWLGHILRTEKTYDGKERLIKLTVRAQYRMNHPGSLCADSPPTSTFEELERIAQDRKAWRQHWEAIAPDNDNNDDDQPHAKTQKSPSGRWLGHGLDAVWEVKPGETTDGPGNDTEETTDSLDGSWSAHATNKLKHKRKRKKTKKSNVGWTNEQRQAWAHAYYYEHHGKNIPLEMDWDKMVSEANAESARINTTTAPLPPTPTPLSDIAQQRTPNGTLWAIPAIPPSPTPPNTPTAAAAANLIHDETPWARPVNESKLLPPSTPATPPQPIHNAPTPPTPTTPQYRRIQQLRQLRLINRNRFKTKGKPAPPRPTTQPTAASQTISIHTPTTPFTTHISPITTHPTHYINTPVTPNSTMNDSLNDTLLNVTPTLIFDHSDFLNETQSPRHIHYINGTYIYTSHDSF